MGSTDIFSPGKISSMKQFLFISWSTVPVPPPPDEILISATYVFNSTVLCGPSWLHSAAICQRPKELPFSSFPHLFILTLNYITSIFPQLNQNILADLGFEPMTVSTSTNLKFHFCYLISILVKPLGNCSYMLIFFFDHVVFWNFNSTNQLLWLINKTELGI